MIPRWCSKEHDPSREFIELDDFGDRRGIAQHRNSIREQWLQGAVF
jgi:hypothetical protein